MKLTHGIRCPEDGSQIYQHWHQLAVRPECHMHVCTKCLLDCILICLILILIKYLCKYTAYLLLWWRTDRWTDRLRSGTYVPACLCWDTKYRYYKVYLLKYFCHCITIPTYFIFFLTNPQKHTRRTFWGEIFTSV